MLQWLTLEIKELGGVNSQREEEEEEEWGCMAEELGGKTEKDAEEAKDIQYVCSWWAKTLMGQAKRAGA